MSKRKKTFSGVLVISILVKHFDFAVVSQRGSHVKLKTPEGRVTIVPLHKELAPGTLAGILHLARVDKEAFLNAAQLM